MGKPKTSFRFHRPQLVLNGTEDRLQLVLAQDGVAGAAQEWTVPGRAMQFLTPALKGMLDSLSLTTADLSGIACVRGPGSFTGIRMILGTALGIARAAELPLAGLDYLPLLAAGPQPLVTGTVAVLTHSRTRQVYLQCFTAPDGTPLGGPQPLSLDAAGEELSRIEGPVFLLGSGLRRNAEFFAELELNQGTILSARFDHPDPDVLAEAALHAEYSDAPIDPLYLRASDAEDNLSYIAGKRGINADEAAERLNRAVHSVTAPSCISPIK